MGLRGPMPKPDAIKAAEGNPGKRRLNRAELAELPKAPPCPGWLDQRAKKEWRRLVKILLRKRVLREEDQIALANLCAAYSQLVHCRELLAAEKKKLEAKRKDKAKAPYGSILFFVTPSGYVQQSPIVSMINSCVDTVTKLSREFGLTPAARTRIRIGDLDSGPPDATAEEQLEAILSSE